LSLLFLAFIYISSSWWVWNYASKFGQRVFIDLYAIVGILIGILLMALRKHHYSQLFLKSGIVILIFFNLFQFYQHYNWVFPGGNITREIYWDSFTSLVPKARVHIPDKYIEEKKTYSNDFETSMGWINEKSFVSFNGKKAALVDSANIYSPEFRLHFPGQFTSENRIVRVGASIQTNTGSSKAALVVEFQTRDITYSYNPLYLSNYSRENRWIDIDYAVYAPEQLTSKDFVKVYFFSGDLKETVLIDWIRVEFLSTTGETSELFNVHNPTPTINKFREFKYSLDSEIYLGNSMTLTSEKSYSGTFSCKISKENPYSVLFKSSADSLGISGNAILIGKARIFSLDTLIYTRFVTDVISKNKSLHYSADFIKNDAVPGQWSLVEYVQKIPAGMKPEDVIKIYFWNPSEDEIVYIDDIEYKFISL
jgi:hypothetical protein